MIDEEKLNDLPKKIGIIKDVKTKEPYYSYDIGKSKYHKVYDDYPWTIIKRVLTKFYKKDVDEAFSYYCTLVPVYQQKDFWEQFQFKRWRYRPWYVDEHGFIQNDELESKYKGPYTLPSRDYKVGWKHKKYGTITETHPGHYIIDNYDKIVISGYIQTFASKNDPRYQREVQERAKEKRKQDREKKILDGQKEYSFLTKAEIEKKKQQQIDLVKKDSHGFDDESFKGEPYHGKKKRKP